MLKSVGGGWIRTSKSGNTYVSISLELDKLEKYTKREQTKAYLVLMEAKEKKTDKHPDYTLSIQVDEE